MTEMTLKGTSDVAANGQRVSLVSGLADSCRSKVNHIDGLRQRNMSIALAIFAVLFGFGLRAPGDSAAFTALALVVLMLAFCLLDRRLHRMSHGWRSTAGRILAAAGDALNNPDQPVTFEVYRSAAEAKAEFDSLQPVLYYLLVLGGALSYFAFIVVDSTT